MRASTRDQRVETNRADTAALITNQGRRVADPAQYYATVVVTRGSASEAARSAAEEVSRKNRRDVLVVAVCVAIVAAAFAVLERLLLERSEQGREVLDIKRARRQSGQQHTSPRMIGGVEASRARDCAGERLTHHRTAP